MNCERTSTLYLNSRGRDMSMEKAIQLKLLDHMGSDLTVVNAARVSFNKRSDNLTEKDKRLIDYLARHKHTTPFRHPHLQFWCRTPIFLARQLGKHQIGMSWNEVSRRYVSDEPEFYMPDCWRKRPEDGIKQGSSDECVGMVDWFYDEVVQEALHAYRNLLKEGVAPEMARMVLPQSMLTEWIWTGSLYAFFNVWKQRADGHAQKEAQFFAELLDKAIPDELRISWETLKEHRP